MDRVRVLAFMAAFLLVTSLAAPAGARFIGTAVAFDKHFGDTIDINVNPVVAGLSDTAFGMAGLNMGVTWGVDVDLGTMAGYPYGYGGLGAVTTGGLGCSVGLSMDEAHGSGFNGAEFGIPLAEQGVTTTHFGQVWSAQNQLDNTNAILPFAGFPVM
ncbi:hypothetical protein [Methanocella conradii]|uniref:hypothetical protein n=1 Tax=Methanocella conradii TaxID=1175444 RepID=UPI00157DCD7E|nr:hypothetical protein [Methanocella conradii]